MYKTILIAKINGLVVLQMEGVTFSNAPAQNDKLKYHAVN